LLLKEEVADSFVGNLHCRLLDKLMHYNLDVNIKGKVDIRVPDDYHKRALDSSDLHNVHLYSFCCRPVNIIAVDIHFVRLA